MSGEIGDWRALNKIPYFNLNFMLEWSKNRTTALCMGYRRWNCTPKCEENELGFRHKQIVER